MFVVKRPFKSFGKTYTVGSVLTEPAGIKRFKGKLAEGKIIKVTEQTYDTTAAYFKAKYGVILPKLESAETENVITQDETEQEVEKPTEEPVKVAKPVTASVKASVVK